MSQAPLLASDESMDVFLSEVSHAGSGSLIIFLSYRSNLLYTPSRWSTRS